MSALTILASAAGAAALAPANAQNAPALTKLKVAAIPIDVSGTVYYAADLGLFKKAGLDVEILSMGSGAAVAPAVSSGTVDIGSSNFISLAQAHERGIPFLMIAPSGVYSTKAAGTQLVVAKSAPFKTGRDLNGKTVAIASLNNIAQVSVSSYVDKSGGDYKSIKFAEIPFALMANALASGRVDAAEISEPYLTAALAGDARVLAHDGDSIGKEWVEGGYFAMADYVKRNPDILRKFSAAIAEAGRWANRNPDDSAIILVKYSKSPLSKVTVHTAFPEKFKPSDAQIMIDAAAKYGALKASFPSADMMAPEAIF